MDDKHRCKVGEPGCPVVAVEHRRQVSSVKCMFWDRPHDFIFYTQEKAPNPKISNS